jgi:hypothetical protein
MGWPQQQFDANESLLEKDLAALKEQAPEEGFVALTDTPPTVPVGITSARQKASFHIVRGDW